MHIEVIDTFDGFQALEPVWNELLARSDQDTPFLSFEWVNVWWRDYEYDSSSTMMVLLVREGEKPIALAPLLRRRTRWRGFPVRTVELMAHDQLFRSGLILGSDDPGLVEYIVRYLRESVDCDIMLFDRLVSGSRSHAGLVDAFRSLGIPFDEMKSYQSPYIPITEPWEDYYRMRSKNLRSKLRLAENQMKRKGGYEIVSYTGRGLDAAWEAVMAISRKTWKFQKGSAIANCPRATRFYRNVSDAMAARGWLNLRLLRLAGTPIAFAYNLDYKGNSYFLKTGFDEEYRSLASTGEFLNFHALKESFAAGHREYDLLGMDESYKMRLTSLVRDHRKLVAFSGSFYGRMLSAVQLQLVPFVKPLAGRLLHGRGKQGSARS